MICIYYNEKNCIKSEKIRFQLDLKGDHCLTESDFKSIINKSLLILYNREIFNNVEDIREFNVKIIVNDVRIADLDVSFELIDNFVVKGRLFNIKSCFKYQTNSRFDSDQNEQHEFFIRHIHTRII